MENDEMAGVIAVVLGIAGMSASNLNFQNPTPEGLFSFAVFLVGLYLSMRKI